MQYSIRCRSLYKSKSIAFWIFRLTFDAMTTSEFLFFNSKTRVVRVPAFIAKHIIGKQIFNGLIFSANRSFHSADRCPLRINDLRCRSPGIFHQKPDVLRVASSFRRTVIIRNEFEQTQSGGRNNADAQIIAQAHSQRISISFRESECSHFKIIFGRKNYYARRRFDLSERNEIYRY